MIIFTTKEKLLQWLTDEAKKTQLSAGGQDVYLLAHSDDGVTWGIVKNGILTVEKGTSAPLSPKTLQQARLFNINGELLLWRKEDEFKLQFLPKNSADDTNRIEEQQLLWGDTGEPKGEFTLMSEGVQGLHHAPPLTDYQQGHSPILTVHHYIAYDDEGQAYIKQSRLVDLKWSISKRGKHHDA